MHGLIHRSVVVAGAAAALLVPVLAVAGPAAALPSNCSQSGSTVTCTFSATGSASWTVPPGVSRATFTVDGAAGGGGANVDASGGLGGQVSAALTALSSGQVFTVSVGGAGQAHVPPNPGAGGVNGGGSAFEGGGGGGGFSSVSLGSTLELLAGGGGGGGSTGNAIGTPPGGGAGGGGGQSGSNGSPGGSTTSAGATLGGGGGGFAGGDATSPGLGGAGGTVTGTSTCSTPAGPGVQGGSGSTDKGGDVPFVDGGGGGAGYVGGGGGGGGAGDGCSGEGGGGGGGGGSSYAAVSGAAFSTGVQSGDGQVTISYTVLAVATASLPAATGGRSYTATLAATGGVTPYSWSVPPGTLPPGLRLSAAGVISGIPDVAGTYTFTVTVTDAESPAMTATQVLSITVSGPVITGLRPAHGPSFGGTLVKITGTGLSCPRHQGFFCRVSVAFGGHRAFVLFTSPAAIWVIAPPGHGTVQVTVKVGGVSSQATAAGLFTYHRIRFPL